MSTFEFKPATREDTKLLIGLAGASGAGKTKSALELATGIAGDGGRIIFIDTEAKRALHYAPAGGEEADPAAGTYRFHHVDAQPPFPPQKFQDYVKEYEKHADVMIFDSASHEFEGIGSISEMADNSTVKGPGAWKEPKKKHKLMMDRFLQARCHLIFCLRAHEKIRLEPDPDKPGKTRVIQEGWSPVCEKSFMFEMTLSLTLRPDMPGRPDYSLPHKVNDKHLPFFREGQFITPQAGKLLALWADGKPMPMWYLVDAYAQEFGRKHKQPSEVFRQWWDATKERREALEMEPDRKETMNDLATSKLKGK